MPQYVIDAPRGGGKVPVNPNYVLYRDAEKTVIRNYEGRVFEYPEAGGAPREAVSNYGVTKHGLPLQEDQVEFLP